MYILVGLLISIWLFVGPVDKAVVHSAPVADACVVLDPDPPPYYQIDLVSTRKVPGAGVASGVGDVVYKATPFGIAVGADGSYNYKLDIKIDRMAPARKGTYVAWVSTPQLDNIKQLGPLEAGHQISGEVEWNKFLVIITLEETVDADQPRWKGPVVLRGISRSGLMHTMAGHGPYESEPCAIYGY